MPALFTAMRYRSPDMLLEAIQDLCTENVYEMEDDDFRYLLACIDKTSYTEDTRVMNWRCLAPRWIRGVPNTPGFDYVPENPHNPAYTKSTCDSLNTQDVRLKVRVTGKRRTLPDGMRHPKIKTLVEAHEAISAGYPEDLINCARWVDSDWSLVDIADSLELAEIATIKQNMYSIIEVEQKLRCGFLPQRGNALRSARHLWLPSCIQRRVHDEHAVQPEHAFQRAHSEDVPIKRLLYHHGCYVVAK